MILKARYVLPVSSQPIESGAVEIRESRIVSVRRAAKHEGGAPPLGGGGQSVIDCGDAIILPGFVNAHTHLELSHLAGRVPPAPEARPAPNRSIFVDWAARLMSAIREAGESAETAAESVQRGAALSLAAGVTALGDITRKPAWTRPVLSHGRLRVVSFGEVIAIGALRGRLDERLAAAVDATQDTERLTAAISPHAPYSCDRRAIRGCVKAASQRRLRLCMHLAETLDEGTCTLRGEGPLVDFIRWQGVWDDAVKPPGLRPVAYAAELGVLSPRTVLAHVNYVSDEDIALIARGGAHVAYCPRTHAAFGHPPHRFREMLRAGINVCVGTDSLASNPSLSVLDELRFLLRGFDDLDPHLLLEMGTLRGAQALGIGDQIGSLEAGKDADVAIIPCDPSGPRDPCQNLLRSEYGPAQVYVAGRAALHR